MIDFKKIEISDKVWIDELLSYTDYRGAEYCFTNLFIWETVFNSRIARYKDFILFTSGEGDSTRYLLPAGRGDLKEALQLLENDAHERGVPFTLIGIDPSVKDEVSKVYPNALFSPERGSFDYIYESEKLISLAGKKLQSKRNHLARFRELEGWVYEEITPQNIGECIAFNKIWCKQNGGCIEDSSLKSELCAVKRAMENFFDLKLKGGLLRLNGEVVAYTVGEPINSDTVIVHIEKAFSEIRGAYQMINREFAERIAKDYAYINREDDAGDEGLRKAKLSYHPIFLQEKYSAKIF